MTKKAKAEQAIEDPDAERNVICEDDEEHVEIDLDSDSDDEEWDANDSDEEDNAQQLYESPLDKVDEVLYLGEHLQKLAGQNDQFYKFLLEQIQDQIGAFNAAMAYAHSVQA